MSGYLEALALTCVVEVPWYLGCFRALGWRLGLRRALVLAIGVNLITHPVLYLVALGLESLAALALAELVVVSVEALIIWLVVRREPIWTTLAALGANALSLVLGLMILN